jgi:hypothetical protein
MATCRLIRRLVCLLRDSDVFKMVQTPLSWQYMMKMESFDLVETQL